MVKTKWWIDVQSSEDGKQIAPTPPASPVPRFSEGSGGLPCGTTSSASFSTYGSLMEIVSPTAEDHILDYALSCRKMKNDGQLVLLSNDVILTIKAMAEVRYLKFYLVSLVPVFRNSIMRCSLIVAFRV